MRIAILTHSTNPRGGVVHALALGEALTRLGHEAVVHAPDAKGTGFFREVACETLALPVAPPEIDLAAMVRQRVEDYIAYFANPAARRFDAYLAGDGISGNALASLKARGLIQGFARTIHHIDSFDDPVLTMMQARSIVAADRHLTVSRLWQERLAQDWAIEAEVVGNGVDRGRFMPLASGHETALAQRLGIAGRPVLLAVGGVEARKNTIAILDAFIALRTQHPMAQLVIAGGASVLDHSAYRSGFAAKLALSGMPADAVRLIGPVADADMPDLYRLAHVLVFPSVKEGFGLVVLEAMASGVPVVTSRIQPFTEYLGEDDVAWCDPASAESIAQAVETALDRPALRVRGLDVAGRHDWADVAQAYLARLKTLVPERLHHA